MSESRRSLGWAGAVATCAVVAMALTFVAWAKLQTVQITYAIDDLIDQDQVLANEQRRLRTQLAELRSPSHLESLARGLDLVIPEPGQVVVVTESLSELGNLLESDPGEAL